MLAFVAALAGCGKGEATRNDMQIKASPAVDPKTGKQRKTLEASLQDPPRK
jgi:hypothetical protein